MIEKHKEVLPCVNLICEERGSGQWDLMLTVSRYDSGQDSVRIRSAALLARFTIARAATKSQKRTRYVLLLESSILDHFFLPCDRLTFVNTIGLNLEQPPCLKWSSFAKA